MKIYFINIGDISSDVFDKLTDDMFVILAGTNFLSLAKWVEQINTNDEVNPLSDYYIRIL